MAELIVALDCDSLDARKLIKDIGTDLDVIWKIGGQLVSSGAGFPIAIELANSGYQVFMDLKLLEIDSVVEQTVLNLACKYFAFTTVHAYPKVMAAAKRGIGPHGIIKRMPMRLLAVTVLTTMDDRDISLAGYTHYSTRDLVRKRARQAFMADMDGVVCSPKEIDLIREVSSEDFLIVTPGIRTTASTDDQKRFTTAKEAVKMGATHIVVGRPITQSADPRAEVERILEQMAAA